jgi:pyruvate/2-oxoglutarate/acetoin dehydrogenase E1 component
MDMTYKEAATQSMLEFAADPKARFVGYGLLDGKGGNGTMKTIPNEKIVETTVCEGLMVGIAQGLAMQGFKPMVLIERADFIWRAMDAIALHLDQCEDISRGEFKPGVIIRVVIGNKEKPLFTGPTHTGDPVDAVRDILRMPVVRASSPTKMKLWYSVAMDRQERGESTTIFERKDLY